MNRKEFTDVQEMRAVHMMRTLYDTLIHDNGGLTGLATFPACASEKLILSPHAESVYVCGDRSLLQFQNGSRRVLSDSIHKYYGIHTFALEGIPYLAAGHSSGIDVFNLLPGVYERRQILFQNGPQGSAFKTIATTGTTIEDMVLFASHSSIGVLRVPLQELYQDCLSISTQDPIHLPLYVGGVDTHKEISQIRIATDGLRLFVSMGESIMQLRDGHRHFDILHKLDHDTVSTLAYCADDLYIGTTQGRIFCGDKVIYQAGVGTSISAITATTDRTIFFTSITNGSYSPLYSLDSDKVGRVVSSPFVQARHIFGRGKSVFVLDGPNILEYVADLSQVLAKRTISTGLIRARNFCLEE